MAVRRVSDLPELHATYPNADTDKCLIEVSYNASDKVYQSFYVKATDLLSASVSDALPHASSSQFGVVKIANGDNGIQVREGLVSVPFATETTPGVITLPYDANYIKIQDGKIITADLPTQLTVIAGEYEIIDVAYPVSSLYMTLDSNGTPPGCRLQVERDNIIYGSVNTNGNRQMRWEKLPNNMSIWSYAENAGNAISGLLPDVTKELSIATTGSHQHQIKVASSNGGGFGSGSHVTKITAASGTKTTSTGSHSHTLLSSTNATGVYQGTDNVVRPTSMCVVMWKRINDDIISAQT